SLALTPFPTPLGSATPFGPVADGAEETSTPSPISPPPLPLPPPLRLPLPQHAAVSPELAASVSLLRVLCRWMYGCPAAARELLESPSNLFLVDLAAAPGLRASLPAPESSSHSSRGAGEKRERVEAGAGAQAGAGAGAGGNEVGLASPVLRQAVMLKPAGWGWGEERGNERVGAGATSRNLVMGLACLLLGLVLEFMEGPG
ncbi:unnamed protein product, partial [Discosporangium mesarthrocarpum]